MRAGNSRAVRVGFLMAGDTLQRWNAFVFRSAHHVGEMPVAIIALLREVGCCVTVDAARMCQYRIYLLPGLQTFRSCRCADVRFLNLVVARRSGHRQHRPCTAANQNQRHGSHSRLAPGHSFPLIYPFTPHFSFCSPMLRVPLSTSQIACPILVL
jgi:hypothetical protein